MKNDRAHASASSEQQEEKESMKPITSKMVISLVSVAVAAPFILIALVAGARAVELAQNAQDDAMLVVLAFCGAVISMINGFGRRTSSKKSSARSKAQAEGRAREDGVGRAASAANPGY